MTESTWIVVPCQRNRRDMLIESLESFEHPTDRVVVVATYPNPLTYDDLLGLADHVILHKHPEQYISRWWNQGIDYVRGLIFRGENYEIFAPSSDMTGNSESIPILREYLREENLAVVGPDYFDFHRRIFRLNDPRTVHTRVPGACWMLQGETGLRLDENFRWWYSDDDLEMQARDRGGAGVIGGTGLRPGPDSPLTDEKFRWAAEDRLKFIAKWGIAPW